MTGKPRILVTGARGQIGSELVPALRERYGRETVLATDLAPEAPGSRSSGPYEVLDVTDRSAIDRAIVAHGATTLYHLAAILSAAGETRPEQAWKVNVEGTRNVLSAARDASLDRVFVPSSIAVFGPETPRDPAPQETVLRPTTVYGISKVAGELLGDYYQRRFGLDVRGLRYPGIISSQTPPGGGTTDYAVEIFYAAIVERRYVCFVREDTVLPMMYMPDCLRATISLMEADPGRLRHHCDFNLAGMSFSAAELAAEIRRRVPGFVCEFRPDHRQAIADSWPRTIDDRPAREEWGWKPSYTLATMAADMLRCLSERREQGDLSWTKREALSR